MKNLTGLVATGIACLALASCGVAPPLSSVSPPAVTASQPSTTPGPSGRETLPPPSVAGTPRCPTATEGVTDPSEAVPGGANIFGAGLDTPPAPGGGGAGSLPPVRILPSGSSRIVTFPSVTGCVNPIIDTAPWNGPAGDLRGPTDVTSFRGISGIVNEHNGMFLVGVFLTDDPPSSPAPERLDFTDAEQFEELAPEIGQTFLIGDGAGRRYRAPSGATRLFLGFADGFLYRGAPGWYGNNRGELQVTIEMVESPG